jgi:tripartite-type tricarboxylate transporter receptor subunit TctC
MDRRGNMKRCSLLLLAALMLGMEAGSIAAAQEYPTRQITLIAPWPAGGAVDALCRVLAPYLADRLGKPVVVENRPGAGSVIGTAAGAKSTPDGYTLVMAGSGSLAISATMYKKLPYDPVKDFEPIGLVAKIPFVLVVNPSLPVRTVAELVGYAKEHPGQLSYASGGPGSPHHLQAEMLKSMTGIEMTHVPYKGSARRLDRSPNSVRARNPADCRGRRSRIRRRRLGHDLRTGGHAERGRDQVAGHAQQRSPAR